MKRIFCFVLVILVWTNICHATNWEIEEQDNNTVTVRIEGSVQKGDKLTFWFQKGNCNIVEHTFSFYSRKQISEIEIIEGKQAKIKNLGMNIEADLKFIISAEPYMKGNFALFSIGHYKVNQHIEFLKKYKTFDVKLESIYTDSTKEYIWKAHDFFDITENYWDLTGVENALLKGKDKCENKNSQLGFQNVEDADGNLVTDAETSNNDNLKGKQLLCRNNDAIFVYVFKNSSDVEVYGIKDKIWAEYKNLKYNPSPQSISIKGKIYGMSTKPIIYIFESFINRKNLKAKQSIHQQFMLSDYKTYDCELNKNKDLVNKLKSKLLKELKDNEEKLKEGNKI